MININAFQRTLSGATFSVMNASTVARFSAAELGRYAALATPDHLSCQLRRESHQSRVLMNSSRVLSLVTLLIFTASIGGCNEGVLTQGKGTEPVASTVRLAVFSDAEIILGEDRVGLRDLKGALDQMTRKSPTYLVYEFSPSVPMTVVQDVLKTVAGSQVVGVSYANGDGGADHIRSFYRPVIGHASVAGRM